MSDTAAAKPTPLQWLMLAVGAALVVRYAWVMDDAFVYARYADNALAMRVGLVYNAGEYVEGYSSPAWMLWVLAWRATGLSFWHIYLASGLLAFALFWRLLVRVEAALSAGRPRGGLVVAYLAANYAVLSWFTSGMETPLIELVAAGYALFVVDPRARAGQLLVGLSPLVRPELVLPLAVVTLHAVARRRTLPRLALGVAVATLTAWLAFRIYYYADLLPTTFYLKDAPNPAQGLRYAVNALTSYHLGLVLLVAAGCLLAARRRAADLAPTWEPRLWMLAACLPVVAYVIRIGGDAIHFRYLAFPFCLAACSAAGAVEALVSTFPIKHVRWAMPALGLGVAAASFAMLPPQLQAHPAFGPAPNHHVHEISDPEYHRRNDQLYLASAIDLHAAPKRAIGADPDGFAYTRTLAHSWCANNYGWYDRRIVHAFGLTEPILARVAVPSGRPGHKEALFPLAEDLATLFRRYQPGVGRMRRAVADGRAPKWIEGNLESIEVIERKTFNTHDLGENLRLAFTFPPPIVP